MDDVLAVLVLLVMVLLGPLIGVVAGGLLGVLSGRIRANLKSDLDRKSTMKRWGIALAILGAIAGAVYWFPIVGAEYQRVISF